MDWEERGGCCCNCCWLQAEDRNKSAGELCGKCCWNFACFCFCNPCASGKLYATSLKQECAIINHCCCYMCFPICIMACTRQNIRKHLRIGDEGCIGDLCMVLVCPCCAQMQMQRAVPDEGWDWTKGNITMMQCPFKLMD